MKKRICELDFIRGIAVILMILFHFAVDLKDIYAYPITYISGPWYFIGKVSAILFILVSGIISSFNHHRIIGGIKLLLLGMLLSLFTFLYSPQMYIKFGILHFLGISIILSCYIKTSNLPILLTASTIIIVSGIVFDNIYIHPALLFPIGLRTTSFASLDYYPMFPWYGVFLCGIFLGRTLYKDRKSILSFDIKDNIISYTGKNSLVIYFIHQPVLLLLLYVFHRLNQIL